jgi:hypothetical protein
MRIYTKGGDGSLDITGVASGLTPVKSEIYKNNLLKSFN